MSADGEARRIFDVLLLKEAILAATEADLRAAYEGDLHILKRRCSVCGDDFYTPHAEHDTCRKHAYVGPRRAP